MTHPPSDRAHRVVVVQTTVPDYRTAFFEDLAGRLGPGFLLLSGDEDWHLEPTHAGLVPHLPVRNVFLARRRLLWQSGALRPLLAADVAVVGLNPRILTGWLALIVRRLKGRRSVLWGHAWPRKGRSSKTDHVRSLMRKLADTVIVYTESEATALADGRRPRTDVIAAPNALYRRVELSQAPAVVRVTDLVFVGRLTPPKKPQLLVEAFASAREKLPPDTRLVFVGDGPLREELETRSWSLDAEDRVLFRGHISSLEELRRIYARAIASVSPGDAGLSIVQSLGFGVPMILGRGANHGPEIEAVVEGENCVFFAPSSATALASAIVAVVDDRESWLGRREHIAQSAQARYSIETMVDSFVSALRLDSVTPSQSRWWRLHPRRSGAE
jgi:glycosyltransferase involved in cell wall biosynthesis